MNKPELSQGWHCSVLKNPDAILVYDLRAKKLDPDLHDYAYYLLKGVKYEVGTVHGHILNLISFVDYLDRKGVAKADVSTGILEKFKEDATNRVVQSVTSKGDRVTAERTVDEKVRNIYKWMLWMQTEKRIPPMTIGPLDCRVLCGVASIDELSERRRRKLTSLIPLYPLVSHRASGGSRFKSKAVITRPQQEKLVELFMDSNQSEHLRRRNALIADIAAAVGFRRDSICSLRVDQFDPDQLLNDDRPLSTDTIEVRPARQKRKYSNSFEFPSWLAVEVAVFIAGPRRTFLEKLGVKENRSESIFLSERTGKAITAHTVTKIFSAAVRELGGKPGEAVHALRRLFAMEAVEEEIEFRIKEGMATDTESVCRAVALKMGHADWKSLMHYVSQYRRNIEQGISRREERKVQSSLQAEVQQVRAENERLKAVLALLGS